MAGLVFFVARTGMVDVGEAVEGEFAVAFEAFRGGAAGDLLESGMEEAAEHAVLKGLMKIANLPEFFFDVALLDFLREGAEGFYGGVAGFQGLENGFGGEHAALHGHVDAFEALGVEEAARIADDEGTVDVSARYGVPATVGKRLCAVADE